MPEIVLSGCRSTPLSGYLKALAVLRLVSEQRDRTARGCWLDGCFILDSILGEQELLRFFLEEYAPTPIVAPWNGGSGFYPGDTAAGIAAIEASSEGRFEAYRRVIAAVRGWPEMPRSFDRVSEVVKALRGATAKMPPGKKRSDDESLLTAEEQARVAAAELLGLAEPLSQDLVALERWSRELTGDAKERAAAWWKAAKKVRTACISLERGARKEALLRACRSRLPAETLAWLDAAYVVKPDETAVFNPLLGTGGNEGRLDFTNNFMQRVAELLISGDRGNARALLESSLFAYPVSGLRRASIGQFDPGRAGGFNQGDEVQTKSFKINPWDFVLMLEGTSVLAAAVARRQNSGTRGVDAIPFTVRLSSVGHTSNANAENGRAETWLPLWRQPAGYAEVCHVFGEGRSSIGRRQSQSGIDFSRAVGTLGVDRGINGFVRYAFLERRGTNYIALPVGTIPVRHRPVLRLLDELDSILYRLDAFLRGFKTVPATFASARRRIDETQYRVCIGPDPATFSELVRALGRMEMLVAQRDRTKKPELTAPLTGLSARWVLECDDGEAEVRLAAALASIGATGKVGPIRSNMAGVDARKPWKWATGRGQHHWHGSSLVERIGGVLTRRLMDAERLDAPVTPIVGSLTISPYDVVRFLLGETDDAIIEELLWGFTLVSWRRTRDLERLCHLFSKKLETGPLPRGFAALKLLCSPQEVRGERLRHEPRIPRLLNAGRAEEAVAVAMQRLKIAGLSPLPVVMDDWVDPQRLLAGLLVPTREQWQLESLVLGTSPKSEEKE